MPRRLHNDSSRPLFVRTRDWSRGPRARRRHRHRVETADVTSFRARCSRSTGGHLSGPVSVFHWYPDVLERFPPGIHRSYCGWFVSSGWWFYLSLVLLLALKLKACKTATGWTERDRERERERERETDRQTDRETDRQSEKAYLKGVNVSTVAAGLPYLVR